MNVKGVKMRTSEQKFADLGSSIVLMLVSYVVYLGLAFPVMWAWNYVIPHLFDLPDIAWGHSFCILFLASHIIKGYAYLPRDK